MGGYQPSVYREQGGNTLVVASSGKISLESGSTMTVASGAGLAIEGTAAVSGAITCGSGGYVAEYVQTAATTATTILPYGLTMVTGTTAGPTFLISNPIAGVPKYLALAGSTAATYRAIIAPASTAVSFGTSGANMLTLSTSTLRGVTLIGVTTTYYRTVGMYHVGDAGLGNVST